MERQKIGKVTDKIIIGSLIFVIITGVLFNIYITATTNTVPNYDSIFASAIFLVLYIFLEKFYSKKLAVIPQSYYYTTMIFAFLSVYLGSYLNFYELFGWWDIMLHFSSGILLGLVSIILVSFVVTHRFGAYRNKKDILFLIIVGILTSISIAVFWEFYEYLFDYFTGGNMQRSFIVEDPATYDYSQYLMDSGRFIDPGLKDTMADQFLAVAGAIIAGIISYFHFSAIQYHLPDEELN